MTFERGEFWVYQKNIVSKVKRPCHHGHISSERHLWKQARIQRIECLESLNCFDWMLRAVAATQLSFTKQKKKDKENSKVTRTGKKTLTSLLEASWLWMSGHWYCSTHPSVSEDYEIAPLHDGCPWLTSTVVVEMAHEGVAVSLAVCTGMRLKHVWRCRLLFRPLLSQSELSPFRTSSVSLGTSVGCCFFKCQFPVENVRCAGFPHRSPVSQWAGTFLCLGRVNIFLSQAALHCYVSYPS